MKLFLDAERDISFEEPMAMDIDDDVESLVLEATDAFCRGEYNLGYVTDDCSNSVDLDEINFFGFVAAECK